MALSAPRTMDFFASQQHARRMTLRLLVLFVLALIVITAAIDLLAFAIWYVETDARHRSSASIRTLVYGTSIATLAVILSVSAFRILQLASGGTAIARMVSARLVRRNTTQPAEQRLLNVVEEMAIASGIEVPQCYTLDREPAINAFAAGYAPDRAVIIVTRGALETLSRDELQAVIGHEYSHILNGDMRLNVWRVGLLAGILVIGQLGLWLLHEDRFISRLRPSVALTTIIGAVLAAIGYVGLFAGRLIKAAVSRQREFLADSAAVQFTRNPEALALALHKVRMQPDPGIDGWYGEELSHMFFTAGVFPRVEDWLAAHPPVLERIRRVVPYFQAPAPDAPSMSALREWIARTERPVWRNRDPDAMSMLFGAAAAARPGSVLAENRLGDAPPAGKTVAQPPAKSALDEQIHTPVGALAVVCAMFVADAQPAREQQLAAVARHEGTTISATAERLLASVAGVPRPARFTLIETIVPQLRALPAPERERLLLLTASLAAMNVEHFAPQLLLEERLRAPAAQPLAVRFNQIGDVGDEVVVLLALLARAGAGATDDAKANDAFKRGVAKLALTLDASNAAPPAPPLDRVRAALERLRALAPLQKPRVIMACAACVLADQRLDPTETELMRVVSAAIDCPLPPMFAAASASSDSMRNADGTPAGRPIGSA